ncbi:MAG: hypothetical protein QM500_18155 [Methylococcales bacterium]
MNLANGSSRQQRSCRRQACVRILTVLLKYTDLASLRVGFPTADGFVNMTMDYLVNETGLTSRRAERAMRDLKRGQLISIFQPRELKENGEYKGLPAVRCVSRDLFGIFNLLPMLKREQAKAVKRLRRKAEKWIRNGKRRTLAEVSRFRLLIGGVLNGSNNSGSQPFDKYKSQGPPLDFESERKLQLAALDLKIEHPEWDAEKCLKEAK